MTKHLHIAGKLIRGRQRIAVCEALAIPRTGRQILACVRESVPSISYQDLRHILRKLQDEGVTTCLNPQEQTGRLYVLTSEQERHRLSVPEIELQARLRRSKNRLAVFQEMARDHTFEPKPLTATQIRKNLLPSTPMGLNHVLSALKFLQSRGLSEVTARTDKRGLAIHGLTARGRDVLAGMPEQGSR